MCTWTIWRRRDVCYVVLINAVRDLPKFYGHAYYISLNSEVSTFYELLTILLFTQHCTYNNINTVGIIFKLLLIKCVFMN